MNAKERLEHLAGDIELLYNDVQYRADIKGADRDTLQLLGAAARALWHVRQLDFRDALSTGTPEGE